MNPRALVLVAAFALPACKPSASSTTAASAVVPAGALRVTVDADGYHPNELHVPPSRPVTLAFTRTSDEGCGQQLVFPDLHVQRDLPLNQPVVVTVNAPANGRLAFTCGMGMMRGALVAQ